MLLLFLLLACIDCSFQYGYDSGGEQDACGRPYRSGRVYQPPCDIGKSGYCTSAGSAYPWNAVRRFVRENHGLMRRMYGDQKHDVVLKTEINKPQEESNNEDNYNQLRRGFYRYGKEEKYHLELDQDLDLDFNFDENELFPGGENEGRYLKEDVLNTKFVYSDEPAITIRLKDISNAPHFRPTTHKMTTTSKPPAPPLSSTSTTNSPSTSKEPLEEVPSTKELPPSNNKNTTKNNTVPFFPVLLEESKVDNVGDRTTSESTTDTTSDQIVTISTTIVQNLEDSTIITSTAAEGMEKHASVDTSASGSEDINITGDERVSPQKDTMLFQDMEDPPKNKVHQNYEMTGVNACPVKEEVVAPFWANNTRGEVLALLNMYPFEQYVHWEKCTHEFRQMYCREGCRCEQQYRLHRLLAYDPNNECRGIFSDWFRFPSCCVCKCYGLPQEFRVTSRSPRRAGHHFDEPP